MKRWVVTGPVGAGKSLFTSELARLGAGVVDGDTLGHEILARPEIIAAIAGEFGNKYVLDGTVDRAALGRLVFTEPDRLAVLDALTHGPLSELAAARMDALARRGGPPLAVLDAAVYFRLPSPPEADLVIVVDAPPDVRAERLSLRAALAPALAEARVAAQAHLVQDWRRADMILENVGEPSELVDTARRLWDERGPGSAKTRKRKQK